MKKIVLLMLALVLVSCEAENIVSKENVNVTNHSVTVADNEIASDIEDENIGIKNDEQAEESEEENTKISHFRVLCESLNVRNEPIVDSDIIGKLSEGYIGEVLEVEYDHQGRAWYYDNEADGWIAGWYCRDIKLTDLPSENDYASIEITDQYADLYTNINTDIKVYQGEKYRIIDSNFDDNDEAWYQIASKNGTIGWIEAHVGFEYLMNESRKENNMIAFEDLLASNQYDTVQPYIDNLKNNVVGASIGYQFVSDDYTVFNIQVDDMSYAFVFNQLDCSCEMLDVSEAVYPFMFVKQRYLLYYSIVDDKRTLMVRDLNCDNQNISVMTNVLNVYDINVSEYYSAKSDSEYILVEHLTDEKGTISYYDLANNEMILFKRPIEDFDWKIIEKEFSFEIVRRNHRTLEEDLYAVCFDNYWIMSVAEDTRYLVEGEYDQILNQSLDDYSDEGITSHVKQLESNFYSLTVFEYEEYQTDEHNFYIISEYEESEIDTHVSASYVLKWKRGTGNYEMIERITLTDYLSEVDYSTSDEAISQYIAESDLYSSEYYMTLYEHDGMYVLSIGLPSCDGGNYQNLVVWDYKNKKNPVRLDETVFGINEVIDHRYMISSISDGMDGYLYVNDLYSDDVDDEMLSVYYNQYLQIPNTSWIIFESIHSHEGGYYSHPPITDIELFNLETKERKLYLTHDKINDYVFVKNSEANVLTIYNKIRGNILDEGNDIIIEALDFNDTVQVEEFLLRIMELPNMNN